MTVASNMVTVKGRRLEQPTVFYHGSSAAVVDPRGRWNLSQKKVLTAGQLENWGVMRITRDPRDHQIDQSNFGQTFPHFLSTLEKTLGKDKVSRPIESWTQRIDRGDEATLEREFDQCIRQKIRLLVIVLPDNDATTYKQIKKLGDVSKGINTVCLLNTNKKFYKAPASNAGYFANIALKINLKLGGINHTLKDFTPLYQNTMVVGIDVTHPSPGPTKKTAPSVAAMVASVDDQVILPSFHCSPSCRKKLIWRQTSLDSGQ